MKKRPDLDPTKLARDLIAVVDSDQGETDESLAQAIAEFLRETLKLAVSEQVNKKHAAYRERDALLAIAVALAEEAARRTWIRSPSTPGVTGARVVTIELPTGQVGFYVKTADEPFLGELVDADRRPEMAVEYDGHDIPTKLERARRFALRQYESEGDDSV